MKENLLISACLIGANCKYSGGSNRLPEQTLRKLRERFHLLPVCPETAGGLGVPRQPSERRGERVVNRSGRDVTAEYRAGAAIALALGKRFGCEKALLKERSPSCGSAVIYDGSFSATLTEGDGVAAERLKQANIRVYGESEIDSLVK